MTNMLKEKRISDSEARKKLHIQNWSEITEEKIVQFVSVLPQMDPDVAKSALAQFPHFTKMGNAMVDALQQSLSNIDSTEQQVFNDVVVVNMQILNSLDKRLNKLFVTKAEREKIIDAMLEVSQNINNAQRNRHRILGKGLSAIKTIGGGALLIGGAALGVASQIKKL